MAPQAQRPTSMFDVANYIETPADVDRKRPREVSIRSWGRAGTLFGLVTGFGRGLERYSVWYHGLRAETVVRNAMAFQRRLAQWYEAE